MSDQQAGCPEKSCNWNPKAVACLFREDSLCSIIIFNCVDETHCYYRGQSTLLEVHLIKYQSHSEKHLGTEISRKTFGPIPGSQGSSR
jgi:hypothetical protein